MNATAKQQLRRNVANDPYSNPTKTYNVPAVSNEDGTLSLPAQPVYGIDPNHEPIDAYMAVRSIPGGSFKIQGANGAAITAGGVRIGGSVPAGKIWEVLSVSCDLVATATVGNRIIYAYITCTNATTDWIGASSTAVAAAQTGGYDIGFGAPLATPSTTVRRNLANTANVNVMVRESTACRWIGATGGIVIDDAADIDVADALSWRIQYREYDV